MVKCREPNYNILRVTTKGFCKSFTQYVMDIVFLAIYEAFVVKMFIMEEVLKKQSQFFSRYNISMVSFYVFFIKRKYDRYTKPNWPSCQKRSYNRKFIKNQGNDNHNMY